MKHTRPDACLSREMLCFVRDLRPTVEEFAARCGGPAGQCYHVLRKYGLLVVEGGRVRLSRRHFSPDGGRFVWGHRVYCLDRDEVWYVNHGPRGRPPVDGVDF